MNVSDEKYVIDTTPNYRHAAKIIVIGVLCLLAWMAVFGLVMLVKGMA